MKTEISLFRMKITKTHLAGRFSFQIDFGIQKNGTENFILVTFHETLLERLRDLLKFCQNSRINAFWDPFRSILHETLLKSLRDLVHKFVGILG